MDLLQLAQHRFAQLSSLLSEPINAAASDTIETWLRDQVCSVASELCKNERFRYFARWSGDHLARETKAPQRKLVEAVDTSLVECARATATAARSLGILFPADRKELNVGVIQSAVSLEPGSKATQPRDGESTVIEWIATRPFFDLVCVEEYFHGDRGLHLRTSRIDCDQDFWEQCDPRIPLGDYICRGMLLRIKYFACRIGEMWKTCVEQAQRGGSESIDLVNRLFAAKARMDQAIASLHEACHQGDEARLRDACTSLSQVYAAYAPNPKLDWLGLPTNFVVGKAPGVRSIVRPIVRIAKTKLLPDGRIEIAGSAIDQVCRTDVVNGIAGALHVVAPIYRRPIDGDELVEWLHQTKRLVIVDRRPRTVYWDGEAIAANWDRRSACWDFLWKLTHCAQNRRAMDREFLTGPDENTTRVKHRRSELKKIIPASLNDLIEDIRPRGYRLNLDPDKIACLGLDDDDRLVDASVLTELCLP